MTLAVITTDSVVNSRPKILLVDNEGSFFERISDLLAMFNYEVMKADNGESALELAAGHNFDSFVISLEIPGGGFEISQQLKSIEDCEDTPIAFVTSGEMDQALLMEAQFYGAMFVFFLPCTDSELMTQLSSMVRIKALQDALKVKMAQLDEMASTDALTGLYNRRLLFLRMEEEVSRVARHPSPMCILFIDIDHFKLINDTYGHRAGDEVLRVLAEIFRRVLRVSDVVGRFGGEEFLIMLPETHGKQAQEVAERLRIRVEKYEFKFEDQLIPVTVSIGMYFAGAGSKVGVDYLVQAADAALYEAKDTGRNKVVYTTAESVISKSEITEK